MEYTRQDDQPKLPTFGIVTTKYWETWAGLIHHRTVVDGVSMSIQGVERFRGEHDFHMLEGEFTETSTSLEFLHQESGATVDAFLARSELQPALIHSIALNDIMPPAQFCLHSYHLHRWK
jgi:hypothetical protein